MTEKFDQLKQIRDEIVALTESPLYSYRTANNYNPVIGMGNHNANIMFIGEAPGENEAKTGRPFVGAAGKFLDELLASISIPREEVYITNIVKDRPPENRDPTKDEIALYAPFLDRQIAIIQPKVIATLGRFSMEWMLNRFNAGIKSPKITQMAGTIVPLETAYGQISLVPLLHPANALYDPGKKPLQKEHFRILQQFR